MVNIRIGINENMSKRVIWTDVTFIIKTFESCIMFTSSIFVCITFSSNLVCGLLHLQCQLMHHWLSSLSVVLLDVIHYIKICGDLLNISRKLYVSDYLSIFHVENSFSCCPVKWFLGVESVDQSQTQWGRFISGKAVGSIIRPLCMKHYPLPFTAGFLKIAVNSRGSWWRSYSRAKNNTCASPFSFLFLFLKHASI